MARTFDATPFENLRLPTEEEFKEIAKDLKLKPFQMATLERCVTITLDQCRNYEAQQISALESRTNAEGLRYKAEKIRGLLTELKGEIESGRERISAIGTISNLGLIGRILSFEAIASFAEGAEIDCDVITAVQVLQEGRGGTSDAGEAPPQSVSLIEFERSFSQHKMMVDVSRRPDLLLFLLSAINDQFDGWLKQLNQKTDKGGPGRDLVRFHFIFSLACDARDILKKPIRRSGGKEFLDLCNHVFPACGIHTPGLLEAIKRCLKEPSVWKDVAFYNGLGD